MSRSSLLELARATELKICLIAADHNTILSIDRESPLPLVPDQSVLRYHDREGVLSSNAHRS